MAIEEKVVQPESVTNAEQSVTETPQPPVDAIKKQYEDQIDQLRKQVSDKDSQWSEKFNDLKSKYDNFAKEKKEERKGMLEDQGQFKTLWEEAQKTNQEMQQKINNLEQENQNIQTSNEVASTKQTALAALSKEGAIDAEQMLFLLQGKLKRNSEGKVVILEGGIEQDLKLHLASLKNPGSGFDHHFKASNAAGMGAKPSPVANVSSGTDNPWKTNNLTNQIIMENENPDLAAVLKREAQT
tara:strand:- start:98 stop:820 length:723 start_codon:yes stop_codon:yes gene_type:complete